MHTYTLTNTHTYIQHIHKHKQTYTPTSVHTSKLLVLEFAYPAKQHNQEKQTHRPLHTSWISQTNVVIIQLCYFDCRQTFHMFSLSDLRFVLWSLDLDVPCAQRIMGFFISITHKSLRSENPLAWNGQLHQTTGVIIIWLTWSYLVFLQVLALHLCLQIQHHLWSIIENTSENLLQTPPSPHKKQTKNTLLFIPTIDFVMRSLLWRRLFHDVTNVCKLDLICSYEL